MWRSSAVLLIVAMGGGCGGDGGPGPPPPLGSTLFVGRDNDVIAFDADTLARRPGRIANTGRPGALVVLDATVYVHATILDEVVVAEAEALEEYWRIGVTRPGPGLAGDLHWIILGSDTAVVVSRETRATVGTYLLHPGAHTGLWHQASTYVTSDGTCDQLVAVYDPAGAQFGALTAADLGFTAPDPGEGSFDNDFCDPTFTRGRMPRPIGCVATTPVTCAFETGDLATVMPEGTSTRVAIDGRGAGAIALAGGGQVLVAQEEPRGACQVGQLTTYSGGAATGLPLGYTGPACTMQAPDVRPGAIVASGTTVFIGLNGEGDQLLVYDAAAGVQLPSITVGRHDGRASLALLGDTLFVAAALDEAVTIVDVPSLTVAGTIPLDGPPRILATYAP